MAGSGSPPCPGRGGDAHRDLGYARDLGGTMFMTTEEDTRCDNPARIRGPRAHRDVALR